MRMYASKAATPSSTASGLVLIALAAACGRTSASVDKFEYTATAGWYVGTTPNVTSMTIDGQPLASGEIYTINDRYPTYDDALASFVPRNVSITTTTETLMFQIDIGACESIPPDSLNLPITKETDQFFAWASQMAPPSVEFFAECGMCQSKDKTVGYCARAQ